MPVHLRRPLRRALYPDDERGPSPADTRRVVIDGGELLCGYVHRAHAQADARLRNLRMPIMAHRRARVMHSVAAAA